MSEPKNQHIIPRCYLKQFIDPTTPSSQEPYVWIFERESEGGEKKAKWPAEGPNHPLQKPKSLFRGGFLHSHKVCG